MRSCVLMRHGETAMAGLFCGHSDPPLNIVGRRQIEFAASTLREPPEVLYTSDLRRARESAELLASHFAVPVYVRTGLREINFGEWEGLSWQEVEQVFSADAEAWIKTYPRGMIPSAEPYESFLVRVKQEMAFLLAEAEMHAVMAITHGGFIRTALTELYGLPELEAHRYSAQYAGLLALPPLTVEAH